jgi:hypothetical protein
VAWPKVDDGVVGYGAGSPDALGELLVAVVECVETFNDSLQPEAFTKREGPAETSVEVEIRETDTGVAADRRTGQCVGAGIDRVPV